MYQDPNERLAGAGPDQRFVLAYEHLRAIATERLKHERAGHTLQATSLVHEVYLRMAEQDRSQWKSQEHFLAFASQVVRRVLVDHARARLTLKRGRGVREPLGDLADQQSRLAWEDVSALDNKLREFAKLDARRAVVVELRVFGGMTNEQIATALDVARATVASDWALARAWLASQISLPPEAE